MFDWTSNNSFRRSFEDRDSVWVGAGQDSAAGIYLWDSGLEQFRLLIFQELGLLVH